ncbi:MAG: Ca-activated chloride channel family protein [Verrucomicrobiales bacterium]|jgi:Ca-activated chloride channel family protein
MPFAYPWVLFFLVIPVLLLIWTWKRHGHRVVLPFDHGTQTRGTGLKILVNLAQSLPALICAVVILLLAGPQQFGEPRTKKRLTNIQFCLDVSGSMTASYGDGDRYEAAMESINEFLNFREGDAFGLTVFGGHYLHWIHLTSDPSAFRYATPFLGPRRLPQWFSGGTSIGMALDQCLKLLIEREEGDRMIILLSDGYSSDLYGGKDEEIARKLKANGIVVYAIHVAGGSPPDQLATITSITGGEVFGAGDPTALKSVFEKIDGMQDTKLEKISSESMDHFTPYAIIGVTLLGMNVLTLFGLRFTPW